MTKKEPPPPLSETDDHAANVPNSDFKVEIWDISAVTPYDKNPRLNDKAVDAVAASLREFGFRQPIVVDAEGVIIAGHTRFKAANQLGLTKVPVHVAKDLTPEQIRAYRIADNKSGEIAEWDFEILPIELSELRDSGFDMTGLGFSEKELAKLLEVDLRQGLTDPDVVPELPDVPITQKGDLWILGNHRLLCGDSANEADVDRLLDGALINATLTDPPYNVCVQPRSDIAVAAGGANVLHPNRGKMKTPKKMRPKDRPLTNDFLNDEEFTELLNRWFANISRVMAPGGTFYIWGGYANLANYPPALKKNGLYFSNCIVWDKMHPVLTRKDFLGSYELCFYGWKEGAGHHFYGPNNIKDIWEVKKVNPAAMQHLTEKPVELAVRALQYSSKPGDNILELFGGSGSTLIGCEQMARRCFAMEIDQPYCDLIVKRWEEFTGRKATRIAANEAEPLQNAQNMESTEE